MITMRMEQDKPRTMPAGVQMEYPFMHPAGRIKYAAGGNQYINAAKEYASRHSLDKAMPTGAVIVKENQIIGRGANGSDYHEKYGCERVRLNIPTGQNYELCEGCSPKNHSEPRAIADAKNHGKDTQGAELYLWGHWWCCQPCWQAMVSSGITKVWLMEDSQILFNKQAEGNIVGHQFSEKTA